MLDSDKVTTASHSGISVFRQLKVGPEAVLQASVEKNIAKLLPLSAEISWTGSTVPVGAGVPDLLRASVLPEAVKLADADSASLAILGYLRAARRARLETIAERLGLNERSTLKKLDLLQTHGVIEQTRKTFNLAQRWQNILGDVSAIEVKVSDWKRAVAQASRNRIFAHRSFVALPEGVAKRVKDELAFSSLGLGLISIDDDGVSCVIKRARKSTPKSWTYYYTVAARAAGDLKASGNDVPG
ncbi:hypothetical protein [Paracoccus methylarcula]|uniref:hypothetical protein n=1 Tax=Paracoccus methylarcula TaxID=72022 RepID=UPI0011CDC361|nr:hypothetical protein [Paracoccus methylarcula]